MGDPLLPPSSRDGQSLHPRTILLRPGQVLPQGTDETHQQFCSVISDEVIKQWHLEFLKVRVGDGRILGLGHEVRKEREGTRLPPA